MVKSIVLQTRDKQPFFALMDGSHEVSTKTLARAMGTKEVQPVEPKRAEQLTGYRVGGISPFGSRTPLPVWMAAHLLEHETVFINGGQRGFLVEVAPREIAALLDATLLDMAT